MSSVRRLAPCSIGLLKETKYISYVSICSLRGSQYDGDLGNSCHIYPNYSNHIKGSVEAKLFRGNENYYDFEGTDVTKKFRGNEILFRGNKIIFSRERNIISRERNNCFLPVFSLSI